MKMSLERLLRAGMIQKVFSDKKQALQIFAIAKRDVSAANKMLEAEGYDWCLAISYNSMLQAGRALMFLEGYRYMSEHKHVAVVEFVHEAFGKDLTDRMIDIFDRMRKKRHKMVYDIVYSVTRDEAEQAIKWAEEFVQKVEDILDKKLHD